MNFKALIGKELIVMVPAINPKGQMKMRVIGVDETGVWFKDEKSMLEIMREAGLATWPTSFGVFVPFAGIAYAVASLDEVALDEKALGL